MRVRTWRALPARWAAAVMTATATAAAQSNPFTSGGSSSGAAPVSALPAAVDAACGQITSALCAKQNTMMLAVAAGYVLVSTLLALVWRARWEKRGTASGGTRFLVPMVTGAALAGALTGLDPARGDDLRCCLASAVFRSEVLLSDSSMGRAFLFGVLPTMVLYTIGSFVAGMMKH